MANSSRRPSGEFWPDAYYTLREVAIKANMTLRTIREKHVQTGKLRVAELARGSEMVPGYEVARWIDELFGGGGKDDTE
jgi:hypothetical protein